MFRFQIIGLSFRICNIIIYVDVKDHGNGVELDLLYEGGSHSELEWGDFHDNANDSCYCYFAFSKWWKIVWLISISCHLSAKYNDKKKKNNYDHMYKSQNDTI